MTIRYDSYIDVDFAVTPGETEIVVAVRTNDGTPLDMQDALDGFIAALEEAYGEPVAIPLTKKQRSNDPDLH